MSRIESSGYYTLKDDKITYVEKLIHAQINEVILLIGGPNVIYVALVQRPDYMWYRLAKYEDEIAKSIIDNVEYAEAILKKHTNEVQEVILSIE